MQTANTPISRQWIVALLLALVVTVTHWPVLENDFVPFDDPNFVLLVPEVMGGLSWRGLEWAFSTIEQQNYFPLTRLSWMTDAHFFGRSARGFHATSLALHAVNAGLLFFALFRLTRELAPSAFVATVFAVHPLHVESIAWVSTRKDLLAGLFFAAALLAHERRARGDRPFLWSALLTACFALGLLSKPVLVTLPFLLLLLDFWPLERWQRGQVLGLFREKSPLFVLTAVSCWITLVAQESAMASSHLFPMIQRIANAAVGYMDYAERALWPRDLAVLYPMARQVGNQLWVALALLSVGTGLVIRHRDTRPWYFVGWFWFVGVLVPNIGLVQVGAQASADRYTYLSLAGLSILAAWGMRDAIVRAPASARRAATIACLTVAVLWVGFLVAGTREQIRTWKDGRTLFEHAVAVTTSNVGAEYRLALILQQEGDFAASIRHFEEAVRLEPTNEKIRDALSRARRGLLPR